MIKVVLFGAGNVGTHFYKAMKKATGIEVVQWFNRSLSALGAASGNTLCTNTLEDIEPANLYLIAVADDAIANLSKRLHKSNALVVHTAGSIPVTILKDHPQHGVLYPLQTLSKNKHIDFSHVPLCIEANTNAGEHLLTQICMALGAPAFAVNSTQRQALHVSAVFVNNFTNHLFALAEQLCKKHQVDFEVLKPLIYETARKVQKMDPSSAQTGPALRNDQTTLANHLALLQEKRFTDIYQLLTKSIQKEYDQKKL